MNPIALNDYLKTFYSFLYGNERRNGLWPATMALCVCVCVLEDVDDLFPNNTRRTNNNNDWQLGSVLPFQIAYHYMKNMAGFMSIFFSSIKSYFFYKKKTAIRLPQIQQNEADI